MNCLTEIWFLGPSRGTDLLVKTCPSEEHAVEALNEMRQLRPGDAFELRQEGRRIDLDDVPVSRRSTRRMVKVTDDEVAASERMLPQDGSSSSSSPATL
ncbi:MAG: hypothetical protein AAGA56_19800 [Myxococcota bacterium]